MEPRSRGGQQWSANAFPRWQSSPSLPSAVRGCEGNHCCPRLHPLQCSQAQYRQWVSVKWAAAAGTAQRQGNPSGWHHEPDLVGCCWQFPALPSSHLDGGQAACCAVLHHLPSVPSVPGGSSGALVRFGSCRSGMSRGILLLSLLMSRACQPVMLFYMWLTHKIAGDWGLVTGAGQVQKELGKKPLSFSVQKDSRTHICSQ